MRLRLKSPASRLFTQPSIPTQIKENIKYPRPWPFCGEFDVDRWIPRTKGQFPFHDVIMKEDMLPGYSNTTNGHRATYLYTPISQIPHAPDKYPTMLHFVTEMCTRAHISVTKWCIVGIVLVYYLVCCGICGTGLLMRSCDFSSEFQCCWTRSPGAPSSKRYGVPGIPELSASWPGGT